MQSKYTYFQKINVNKKLFLGQTNCTQNKYNFIKN